MKKLFKSAALVTAVLWAAAPVFAQELSLSGEVKTGIYWQQAQDQGKPVTVDPDALRLHSTDEAGHDQGRFRLNLDYDSGKNFGMRGRIDWENWKNTDGDQPIWTYAFGYGNFFEDQLTVAVGKLGVSPWGTGGPEMYKELEMQENGGGMRVEWKPGFIAEENGKLNIGFVLNYLDSGTKQSRTPSFADLLRETVFGVAYTHDLFMIRFAYRLDSDLDYHIEDAREGDEFVYRVEEYALDDMLPGMHMWLMGHFRGLFAEDAKFINSRNWLFAEFDPPEAFGLDTPFTAQVRVGFDYVGYDYDGDYAETGYHSGFVKGPRGEFHVMPSFYWHFFNKLLSVGAMFSYRQDLGDNKVFAGSPYQQIELEPLVQLNFSTSYIAFAYNFKQEYIPDYPERGVNDPVRRTQHLNLRFCIYY